MRKMSHCHAVVPTSTASLGQWGQCRSLGNAVWRRQALDQCSPVQSSIPNQACFSHSSHFPLLMQSLLRCVSREETNPPIKCKVLSPLRDAQNDLSLPLLSVVSSTGRCVGGRRGERAEAEGPVKFSPV